ncbi:hypothetical protein [Latilactobacillus fuchuensis]|nr:hypothetical protein [Latilactobacillus fuchuensis]
MIGINWLMGTPQQSVLWIVFKLILCIGIYLVTVISSSLKNVNRDSLNKNNSQLGTSLGWLFLTVVGWLGSTIIFAVNLNNLISPEYQSDLFGAFFFITLIISSFCWTLITWSFLLANVKKSEKSAADKKELYLNNNLTLNAGITGVMVGTAGCMMLMIMVFDWLTPPATKQVEIHPIRIIVILLIVIVPIYLLVKIPKWFRRYVEKFI